MIRLLLSRGADLGARRNRDGCTVESMTRDSAWGKNEVTSLLVDIRLAGGWDAYVRYPRFKLLALRVLCGRGRASTRDALLQRLFPWHAPADDDL